ncbi:MAG: class I SAM-dependent methyltransferase [Magnetococcales bacterium]|nr:class I SAM-dependent methyltransferase [Magnetococcales bacterium]
MRVLQDSPHHATIPPVMTWLRCAVCDHVFTDGYHAPEIAERMFNFVGANAKTNTSLAMLENMRPVSGRRVERVFHHVAGGDWLDIGFGSGSLLLTAQEWGYTPVGIDAREGNVAFLQSLHVEAYWTSLEQFNPPDGRFSVVSMTDVLEHLPFPVVALQKVYRWLRPAGVLFIAVPNMSSAIWTLMEREHDQAYWASLEHYHNFTRERLYALLQAHGFTPVQYAVSERYRAGMEIIAIKPHLFRNA